jgi:hypothetical protein
VRRAVLALLQAPASVVTGAEWFPSADDEAATAESHERLARPGERRAWVVQDAARATLVRDVRAYACALRDGGMAPRQVVRAVVAEVREAATPSLGPGPLAALLHDAGRCCVEAYFAA